MDGGQPAYPQGTPLAQLAGRLGDAGNSRAAQALLAAVSHLHALVADLKPSPDELKAAIDFLTDVGHSADARRQEWVLLADVIGVSTLVEDMHSARPDGATPNSLAGPFYRSDAPDVPNGANLSRDGRGVPLSVRGRVITCSGTPVAGATVEVWHASSEGLYENQEPENQPDHNLRGRLRTDSEGRFHFRSVMPKGYALPEDGPVGQLMNRLGLRLERPAHVHFRISARGFDTLTSQIFDKDDPAIGRDALFGVKPEFLSDFGPMPSVGGASDRNLDVEFVLAPAVQPPAAEPGKPNSEGA